MRCYLVPGVVYHSLGFCEVAALVVVKELEEIADAMSAFRQKHGIHPEESKIPEKFNGVGLRPQKTLIPQSDERKPSKCAAIKEDRVQVTPFDSLFVIAEQCTESQNSVEKPEPHLFHSYCIGEWLKHHGTCPISRNQFAQLSTNLEKVVGEVGDLLNLLKGLKSNDENVMKQIQTLVESFEIVFEHINNTRQERIFRTNKGLQQEQFERGAKWISHLMTLSFIALTTLDLYAENPLQRYRVDAMCREASDAIRASCNAFVNGLFSQQREQLLPWTTLFSGVAMAYLNFASKKGLNNLIPRSAHPGFTRVFSELAIYGVAARMGAASIRIAAEALHLVQAHMATDVFLS